MKKEKDDLEKTYYNLKKEIDENQATFEKKIDEVKYEYKEDINLIRLRKIHQEVKRRNTDLELENKNLKQLLSDKGKVFCNY